MWLFGELLSFLLLLAQPAVVQAQFTFTTNNGAITISNLLSQPRRASSSAMIRLALCSAVSRSSSPFRSLVRRDEVWHHNNELLSLFVRHEETLFRLLAQHEFIELSRNQVIVHR
jgi:hypothetical protein